MILKCLRSLSRGSVITKMGLQNNSVGRKMNELIQDRFFFFFSAPLNAQSAQYDMLLDSLFHGVSYKYI